MNRLPAVRPDPALPALVAAPETPVMLAADAAARLMCSGRDLNAVGGTAATMTAGFAVCGAMAWAAGAAMLFAAATAFPQAVAPAPANRRPRAKVV